MVSRCLRLGAAVAAVTAALWSVSGFIFPSWMRLATETLGNLSPERYAHFVATNVLCGHDRGHAELLGHHLLLGAVLLSLDFAMRSPDGREMAELAGVARMGRIFLGLTVAVPFLALAVLLANHVERPVIAGLAVSVSWVLLG